MLTDAELQAIRERANASTSVHSDDVFDLLAEVERLRSQLAMEWGEHPDDVDQKASSPAPEPKPSTR